MLGLSYMFACASLLFAFIAGGFGFSQTTTMLAGAGAVASALIGVLFGARASAADHARGGSTAASTFAVVANVCVLTFAICVVSSCTACHSCVDAFESDPDLGGGFSSDVDAGPAPDDPFVPPKPPPTGPSSYPAPQPPPSNPVPPNPDPNPPTIPSTPPQLPPHPDLAPPPAFPPPPFAREGAR